MEEVPSCGIMHSHKASKLCKLQLQREDASSQRGAFLCVSSFLFSLLMFMPPSSSSSEDNFLLWHQQRVKIMYEQNEWYADMEDGRMGGERRTQNVFRRWTIKPSIIIVSKVLLPLSLASLLRQSVQSSLSSKTCIPTMLRERWEAESLISHYSCKRLSRHHHQHFE